MDNKHGIEITTRDRVLRAWMDSMELVRDFKAYAKESEDDAEVVKFFEEYAEDEGFHASKLLEILRKYENK